MTPAERAVFRIVREEIRWRFDGSELRVGFNRAGTGPVVLLLPALSSISTRSEMRPLLERLASSFTTIAFDRPAVGPLLFRLNVNRFMVTMMARGHVYSDPGWLTGELMRAKLAAALTPGARHASARFVTGYLNPFPSRDEFLDAIQCIKDPVFAMFSNNAPRISRVEMEALAAIAGVTATRLLAGKLSVYGELSG